MEDANYLMRYYQFQREGPSLITSRITEALRRLPEARLKKCRPAHTPILISNPPLPILLPPPLNHCLKLLTQSRVGATLKLQCVDCSLQYLLFLWGWALKCSVQASVAVAHGLSCLTAGRIFLDKGSNLCPLQWQVAS